MSSHNTNVVDAPDFSLVDTEGNRIKLSDYRGHKNVVLVFNRGFL